MQISSNFKNCKIPYAAYEARYCHNKAKKNPLKNLKINNIVCDRKVTNNNVLKNHIIYEYQEKDPLFSIHKPFLTNGVKEIPKDKNGMSLLHIAVIENNLDCVKELIKLGNSPDEKDYRGLSPYDLASAFHNKKIMAALKPKVGVEQELCHFIRESSRVVFEKLYEIAETETTETNDYYEVLANALNGHIYDFGDMRQPSDILLRELYEPKLENSEGNPITAMASAVKHNDTDEQDKLIKKGWCKLLEDLYCIKINLDFGKDIEGVSSLSNYEEFKTRYSSLQMPDISSKIRKEITKRIHNQGKIVFPIDKEDFENFFGELDTQRRWYNEYNSSWE